MLPPNTQAPLTSPRLLRLALTSTTLPPLSLRLTPRLLKCHLHSLRHPPVSRHGASPPTHTTHFHLISRHHSPARSPCVVSQAHSPGLPWCLPLCALRGACHSPRTQQPHSTPSHPPSQRLPATQRASWPGSHECCWRLVTASPCSPFLHMPMCALRRLQRTHNVPAPSPPTTHTVATCRESERVPPHHHSAAP